MSRSYAAFASLSVFAILLGTSSIAAAQVIPPQPAGAPAGGVEFFLPTYVTPSGTCACWDSDGNVNGGYNPEIASAIFGVCYYNMVAPDGTPYTLYVTNRTVPSGVGSCYAEFVCGQPNYTDSNGVTQPARKMFISGPDLDPATETIYSEIDTECTNCNLSPLKGWVGYQGSGMNGVAPELMNISYSAALVETQLGGFYDWSSGSWTGGGNYLNNGSGYQLPYCVGSYTPQSLPNFPPLNMGGGGNVISEYPGQYELGPVGVGNTGGNTGGNVLNTANLTKAVNAANGGKEMNNTVDKKTTVIKGKYYTTYRTEIIVKPAPVKKEAAPVKAAPVTKK